MTYGDGRRKSVSDVVRRVCGAQPSDNHEMVKRKRVARIYFSFHIIYIFSHAVAVSSWARAIEDCTMNTATVLYTSTV